MDRSLRARLHLVAEKCFRESIAAKEELFRSEAKNILEAAEVLSGAFRENRRLFIFGNGGSAADAQHLAAEFVNRFVLERPPLPAVALTVDTSIITSISNDYHFDDIFLRQLQALAQPGDVALGISTSGRSANVVKALKWARGAGLRTVGFCGAEESDMDRCCDLLLHAPSRVTARIQECHITVGHVLCELVEEILFCAEGIGE